MKLHPYDLSKNPYYVENTEETVDVRHEEVSRAIRDYNRRALELFFYKKRRGG